MSENKYLHIPSLVLEEGDTNILDVTAINALETIYSEPVFYFDEFDKRYDVSTIFSKFSSEALDYRYSAVNYWERCGSFYEVFSILNEDIIKNFVIDVKYNANCSDEYYLVGIVKFKDITLGYVLLNGKDWNGSAVDNDLITYNTLLEISKEVIPNFDESRIEFENKSLHS